MRYLIDGCLTTINKTISFENKTAKIQSGYRIETTKPIGGMGSAYVPG